MPSILTVIAFSIASWVAVIAGMSAMISVTRDTTSIWFAIGHWVIDILVSALVFGIYAQRFHALSPFMTMVVAMLTLFVIEFIFWNFIYHGNLQLFNFMHFIFPFFLIASTIYFVCLWVPKL